MCSTGRPGASPWRRLLDWFSAKGRGTKGSPLILRPCNGSPNEIWIRKPSGEQAAVGVCSDARDQRWSLP
jgi:hypothetical protein